MKPYSSETAGRALFSLVKAAWVGLFAASLSVFAAGMPVYYRALRSVCAGESCEYFQLGEREVAALAALNLDLPFYAAYMVVLTCLVVVVSLIMAVILFWRRGNSRMATFLSFMLVGFWPTFFYVLTESLVQAQPIWRMPINLLRVAGISTILIFPFIFPNGHFYPRWTKLFVITVAVPAVSVLVSSYQLAVDFNAIQAPARITLVFLIVLLIAGAAAQLGRYHLSSGPLERQQIKWVVFSLSMFGVDALIYLFVPILFPGIRENGRAILLYYLVGGSLNVVFLLFFILSLANAILRYRLWDIDVIVRRSLIYSLLTGAVVTIFFGSIILLQLLFPARSEIATVISTLLVAAIFNTLFRRIRNFIDRRFYRRRYSAEKTLAQFAATNRNQMDIEHLTGTLLNTVEETLQPSHAALWLRKPREEPLPLNPISRQGATGSR